jgi:hypothetical protein
MTITRPLNVAAALLNGIRVPGKTGIDDKESDNISVVSRKIQMSLPECQRTGYIGTGHLGVG